MFNVYVSQYVWCSIYIKYLFFYFYFIFYVNFDINLMSFQHILPTGLDLFFFLQKAIYKYQQIDKLLVNLAQKLEKINK